MTVTEIVQKEFHPHPPKIDIYLQNPVIKVLISPENREIFLDALLF